MEYHVDQLVLPFVFDTTSHPKLPQHPLNEVAATVLPFPTHLDGKLVARLAAEFITLRERHGRQCRLMLLSKRFKPIGVRLRRMGVSPVAVEQELALLEKAVAREVWVHDGRPSLGSGGGNAA